MDIFKEQWSCELHLPHGSADGYWRVIRAASDNGDVIAVVDPHDDFGDMAEPVARALAAAPKLLRALGVIVLNEEISGWLAQNDPMALAQAKEAFYLGQAGRIEEDKV